MHWNNNNTSSLITPLHQITSLSSTISYACKLLPTGCDGGYPCRTNFLYCFFLQATMELYSSSIACSRYAIVIFWFKCWQMWGLPQPFSINHIIRSIQRSKKDWNLRRRGWTKGSMSAAAAGCCCWCCCWLLLLVAAAGCCWLLLLVAAGCCCWLLLLLLLVAAAGCCCWLLLLVAAACCCWLLLVAAAGCCCCCCCWLLLLVAAGCCCCCCLAVAVATAAAALLLASAQITTKFSAAQGGVEWGGPPPDSGWGPRIFFHYSGV